MLLWTERLLYCLWGLDVGHIWRSSCWAPFPVCRQAATRNPTEGNGSAPVLGVLGKQLPRPQRDVLRSCRIPWLWFGYCLVFLSCPELQQFHYALSFISSFHFFGCFFLHRRTETVRRSCQCSLAPPSYIKKQFTH